MTAAPDPGTPGQAEVWAPGTRLVTLVFTDVVGSTALKQALGDRPGAAMIQQHHQLVREILALVPAGEEIETAGDSFLLLFHRPSDAVQFTLRLQSRLRQFKAGKDLPLQDRVGIHLGEVVVREGGGGSRPKGLEGIAVDTCARVMSLASAGQILMTRAVFDNARQMLKGEDVEGIGALSWVSHGRYLLKGVDEPVEICEVAETGQSPLRAPETTEKARRHTSPDEEPVLGWRPAVGQQVGRTEWVLEEKLGEGGFGEVWVGRHRKLKERRVFKFCFRADRVRSLKRELTLFRLLKERVGEHPNIVRLHEVYFDEPPYFLEEDYVEGRDLGRWCEAQGGVDKVPLEGRLEIVAQVADALQAAHECGVIHRDVKPGNILVSIPKSEIRSPKEVRTPNSESETSSLLPWPSALSVKLTDFGIGQVVSEEYLSGITKAGFTETMLSTSSSRTGTQLYLAPELLAGEPATTRSDLYSLGVVLYQLLVGAFNRPLTSDWAEEIADPLLRDDVRHCVAGKPTDRFVGAGQLAKNLRALPERRAELARREAEKAALERAAYRRGMLRTAGVAAGIVAVIAGLALLALNQSKRAKASELAARESLYAADMNLAYQAWQENNLGLALELLARHRPAPQGPDLRGWEWRHLWNLCRSDARYTLGQHSDGALGVFGVAISPDDKLLATIASSGGALNVWDLDSRRLIETPEPTDARMSVAFSPDGKLLAFATGAHGVKLWDVQKHREIARFPVDHESGFGIPALGFSPNGRLLAIGAEGGPVLWDVASHTEAMTLNEHSQDVCSLVFSRDGQILVTGSSDSTVCIWDLARQRRVAVLTNHTAKVQCLALSRDDKILASGGWDHAVHIWDLAQTRQVTVLTNHTFWVSSLAFSPDGRTLASASADCSIRFWDTGNWRQIGWLKGSQDEVWGIAFTSDGKTLFSGTKGGKILAWDSRPPAPKTHVLRRPGDARDFWLSSYGGIPFCWHSNNTFNLWDPLTLRELPKHPAPEFSSSNEIVRIALLPGGERAAFATRQGPVHLWDVEQEREVTHFAGWPGQSFVEFSPDGKLLAAVAAGKGLKVWDLAKRQEVANITPKSPAIPSANPTFTANGEAVAIANYGGTVEVWDLLRKERVANWSVCKVYLCVAFMPDGKRLVTVSEDCTAILWELETKHTTPRKVWSFGRAKNAFFSVAVSPDGQRIAAGTAEGLIKLWNPTTGQQVVTLKGVDDWVEPSSLAQGVHFIMSLAFLPSDGNALISWTPHEARLWRAPSRAEIEAAEAKERKEAGAP